MRYINLRFTYFTFLLLLTLLYFTFLLTVPHCLLFVLHYAAFKCQPNRCGLWKNERPRMLKPDYVYSALQSAVMTTSLTIAVITGLLCNLFLSTYCLEFLCPFGVLVELFCFVGHWYSHRKICTNNANSSSLTPINSKQFND